MPPGIRSKAARLALATTIVLLAGATIGAGPVRGQELPDLACPVQVDTETFASAERVKALTERMAGFGLRMPATEQHNSMLTWLEDELGTIPGLDVRQQGYAMTRWQPTTRDRDGGLDLATAGRLSVERPGPDLVLPVAAAQPYSRPTEGRAAVGEVVYLPLDVPITKQNARGKILVRDVRSAPIRYAAITAVSYYSTPDTLPRLVDNYDRPYVTTGSTADIEAAHLAGAVGLVQAFNVPVEQVRGYFDPHNGTLQHIPGLWIGVDEREQLKKLAAEGARVRMDVLADVDEQVPTRNVIATLPGQSEEKIVLVTNTDGNTWVQENATAPLLALADWFSALPLECRPKTLEFAFTSGHLAYAWDGAPVYAEPLLQDPQDVSFVFVVEHLGTREILPVPREDGPGQRLVYTGEPEPFAWFAPTESPALSKALVASLIARQQRGSAVLRGLDAPQPGRFPLNCEFGGLANFFHGGKLIPSIGGISGPWSLWAPTFGKGAIDFARLHSQALVIGDTVLALDDLPRAAIEGSYPAARAAVAAGAETCSVTAPPAVAPTNEGSGQQQAGSGSGNGASGDRPAGSRGRALLPATGGAGAATLAALITLIAAGALARQGRST